MEIPPVSKCQILNLQRIIFFSTSTEGGLTGIFRQILTPKMTNYLYENWTLCLPRPWPECWNVDGVGIWTHHEITRWKFKNLAKLLPRPWPECWSVDGGRRRRRKFPFRSANPREFAQSSRHSEIFRLEIDILKWEKINSN